MVKDKSIQIIRIVAMMFIVICHLFQKMPNRLLIMSAQFFNVGVFIFLFISGYLYGKKNIDNYKEWVKRRFKTILIPMYIFIIILFIIFCFKNIFNIKFLFVYLFNIQYFLGGIPETGHLWFLSIIVICYIILLCINKYKKFFTEKSKLILFLITLIAIVLSFFSLKFSLLFWYIDIFLIGYTWNNNKRENAVIAFVALIFSIIMRLIFQKIFDNLFFYDSIIVPILQIIIAISIYIIIKYLVNKYSNKLDKMGKIIDYFDNMSYYIYICHYIFFEGIFCTLFFTNSLTFNILITLILSYVSAIILRFLTEIINKKI